MYVIFVFKDTATTEIYTYGHTPSLHDALPIMSDSLLGSKPPVSTTVACQRSKTAVPYRRSRVTPGTSRTSERRRPIRRLKSVDLPTFGRPTIDRKSTRLNSSH